MPLKDLGVLVQLGHGGCVCPCPSPGPPGFMVFDTSGIHAVNIDYCNCPRDDVLDRRTQLLRQGWFLATFLRPNTVFTFDCLDTFHEHTLQGKGNLYDFYHLLLRKTDNANISDTVVSVFSVIYYIQSLYSWNHCLVSLQGNPSSLPNVEKSNGTQTHWTRTWSRGHWKYVARQLDSWMSCMPTPRSKSPGQLEGSQPPYVCNFFSCFSAKILIVFFQVSLYFVPLHWCKLQAKGQGPRIRRCWADARMGPFHWGVSVSRLYCELRWSAWSEYFLPFLSKIVTWIFSPDQYMRVWVWCYC